LYERLHRNGIHCWIVGRQNAVDDGGIASTEYRSSSLGLEESISGATTVVHLASVSTPATGAANPYLDIENIKFSLSLIDACLNEKVRHLIFAS